MLAWFVLLSVLMAIIAYSIYRSIDYLVEQTAWVSHTHEVLERINDSLSQLKDVQSAQRGYVITGSINFLEPYDAAIPLLKEDVIQLRTLLKDNPEQQKRAEQFGIEAEKRVIAAGQIIEAYNKEGQQSAFEKIRKGLGKKEMDEARRLAAEMKNQERVLLERRQNNAHDAIRITLAICGGAMALCFSALLFAFNMMRLEVKQRGEMQANLEQLNAHIVQVSKLGELLQGCQNMTEAANILSDYVARILPGTYGNIALMNNSRNVLEVLANWGDLCVSEPDFSPDECWGLRAGRQHVVDKEHFNPVCAHLHGAQPSSICMPMMAHGDTIGMFFVASSEENAFDENTQQRLRTVAEQVAMALSNLKLQDTLRMQSVKDPLTMLYNRRYMEVTLEREISRARRYTTRLG